jgi:hypothetical protein
MTADNLSTPSLHPPAGHLTPPGEIEARDDSLTPGEIEPALRAGSRLYTDVVVDAEIDDAILREAIKPFCLYERDARKVAETFGLIDAGSTPEQIASACSHLYVSGLRSAPRGVAIIFAECGVRRRFCHPHEFLAPFYHDGEMIRLNLPTHGLIMPVVRTGLVRAWLHYKHPADDAPRWVTSSHKPRGAKARPSIHTVSPGYADEKGIAVLVGHALEAEAMSRGGVTSYAAVNNVSASTLVIQLREQWPALRGVVMATDDPMAAHVRQLRLAGLQVREEGATDAFC